MNARGWQIKLRPSAINSFRLFLEANTDNRFKDAVSYNLEILQLVQTDDHHRTTFVSDWSSNSNINAEVVFATVTPRRIVNFLVAFLLRFGLYDTKLDLFQSDSLLESYVNGTSLDNKVVFTEDDLLRLLETYVKRIDIFAGWIFVIFIKTFVCKTSIFDASATSAQ